MLRPLRRLCLLAAWAAVAVTGCGGGPTVSSSGSPAAPSGQVSDALVTWLQGTGPDSLDPAAGSTTESLEATQAVYLPLVTYARQPGSAGTQIIPALAADLPKVSPDGRTYTFTLRPGLVYSNGAPVRASDFAHAIERSIRLGWGGKALYTDNIAGAAAYDAGTASSIAGITTDDRSGRIAIRLVRRYGAFLNVLALPSSAPVPSATPMRDESAAPPPGVGPYMIVDVHPGRGYTLEQNPRWSGMGIPGVPAGQLTTVQVRIEPDASAEVAAVLGDTADVLDPADTPPAALLDQIRARAGERFATAPASSTAYFFLNTRIRPFDDRRAREAVAYALDRAYVAALAGGLLQPSCYFIPRGLPGHATGPCPYPGPDLTTARRLVRSHRRLRGARVTVWGMARAPERQYAAYYARLLDRLGFRARLRLVAGGRYWTTVGGARTDPQTGFARWTANPPGPAGAYLPLGCDAIQPVHDVNLSRVCDPEIDNAVSALAGTAPADLSSVAARWQRLEQYTAQQAYALVLGTELRVKLTSDRIDFGAAYLHPVYGLDVTSLALKQ